MKTTTRLHSVHAFAALVLALALTVPAAAQAPKNPTKDQVKATGTLSIEGECQVLTDDSGQRFALVGDLGGAANGDRVTVSGSVGERTTCVQGATIKVEKVEAEKAGEGHGTAPVGSPGHGTINVRGTLTTEGVECQALRGDDGQLYTLTGDLQGFKAGDEVRVMGTVVEVSTCQQGTTIAVQHIKADKAKGDGGKDQGELLRLTGTLTSEGVECQAFRSDKGALFTLTGDLKGFKTGDRVAVTGRVVQVSTCQQGTTLAVQSIKPAE